MQKLMGVYNFLAIAYGNQARPTTSIASIQNWDPQGTKAKVDFRMSIMTTSFCISWNVKHPLKLGRHLKDCMKQNKQFRPSFSQENIS